MTGVASEERNRWVGQMIFVDVTEQRQAQERLRLSRDRLLEQQRVLSALFRSEEFSRGGDDGVRLLTEASAKHMGVDRVGLWLFTEDRSALRCVDLYSRASGRHGNGEILPVDRCPRYVEAINTEEAIVADDSVSDELTRELADGYLRPLGIGSLLDVPVRVGGAVAGVFCHEHVGEPLFWTPEERMFTIAMGSLATLALERGARRQA
jgi:GAF domain-containing protein